MSLFETIRTTIRDVGARNRLQHGWEVELKCPQCGTVALPVYDGWTDKRIGFAKNATVLVNVNCPKCKADLKREAARQLVELFSGVSMHPSRKWPPGVYCVLAMGLFHLPNSPEWGQWLRQFGWFNPFLILGFLFLGRWLSRTITSARQECECGNPSYKFMGNLGGCQCFRCSACGRLLRLQV